MSTHLSNMAACMAEFEEKVCKKFGIYSLRQHQKEAIENLIKGKDVFVGQKTGSGKSMAYMGFLTAKSVECGQALVVSPLNSIMEEQKDFLEGKGFKVRLLGKEQDDDICEGGVDFMFASPELVLSSDKYRQLISNCAEKGFLQLIAIDECHLVLKWGECSRYSQEEEAFRPWFAKLGELRSLAPHVPMLALTATASRTNRTKIKKKLNMISSIELLDNPDRANVKLFSLKFKADTPMDVMFSWLLDLLQEMGKGTPRLLVFTKSIQDTSNLYNMCLLDGNINMRHVEMFHSMTPDVVKDKIRHDMSDGQGLIRALFCTNAAGLGVNYKNIEYVINYGPPQDMDTFLQHLGRAGRTGVQAQHLLLYTGRQLQNLSPDMLVYVRNETECRREIQLRHYSATPISDRVRHLCCDICDKQCNCDVESCIDTLVHPAVSHTYFSDNECEEVHAEHSAQPHHVLDNVRISLEIFAENLSEQYPNMPLELYGLSEAVIEDIVSNIDNIHGPDDLLENFGVYSFSHAVEMYQILCEVIQDKDPYEDNIEDDLEDD